MLLDSAAPRDPRGRWGFMVVDPVRTLQSVDGQIIQDGNPIADADPFQALTACLVQLPPDSPPDGIPFAGGAVGLLSYELGRHLESAPSRYSPIPGQPEMALGFYDSVVVFDLWEKRAWVSALTPEAEPKAQRLIRHVKEIAAQDHPSSAPTPLPGLSWRAEMDRDAYCRQVQRIVDYIAAGDVFQVNMTARFLAERPAGLEAFQVYRALRSANPAPFAAYVRVSAGLTLACASPERFLSMNRTGQIQARPIKGTMPRYLDDPDADAGSARALSASAKDHAENLMIADLLRNDIGRVAELGSVRVPVLCGLESYASVHHLVSVVEGRLRSGLGPVDLLRATFPGGSITGAPKVRAMEIIDTLEPAARGPYCGSVLWIGGDGAMDANIVIRSLVLTDRQIIAQAGGGVVSDSDPQAEYDEMRTKLAPALAVLSDSP